MKPSVKCSVAPVHFQQTMGHPPVPIVWRASVVVTDDEDHRLEHQKDGPVDALGVKAIDEALDLFVDAFGEAVEQP